MEKHSNFNKDQQVELTAAQINSCDSKITKDWIYKYCVPTNESFTNKQAHNIYDLDQMLIVAKQRKRIIETNDNLANSKRKEAIKNIENIISGLEKIIVDNSKILCASNNTFKTPLRKATI